LPVSRVTKQVVDELWQIFLKRWDVIDNS